MTWKSFFPRNEKKEPLVRIDGSLSGDALLEEGALTRLREVAEAVSAARPYTYDLQLSGGRFSLIMLEPILPGNLLEPDPDSLGEDPGWYVDDVSITVQEIITLNPGDTYTYGFETGIDDWYASHGSWEVGTPTLGPSSAYNGTQCAGTVLGGGYPATNTRLGSPAIQLPDITTGEEILLRFQQWFSFGEEDAGRLQVIAEVSPGDYGNWTTLRTFTGSGGGVWTSSLLDLEYQREQLERLANDDDWMVTGFPSPEGEPVIDVYGPSFAMFAGSEAENLAAWLVIKWLASAEQQAGFITANGSFPTRASVMGLLDPYANENPQWASAQDLLKNAKYRSLTPSVLLSHFR